MKTAVAMLVAFVSPLLMISAAKAAANVAELCQKKPAEASEAAERLIALVNYSHRQGRHPILGEIGAANERQYGSTVEKELRDVKLLIPFPVSIPYCQVPEDVTLVSAAEGLSYLSFESKNELYRYVQETYFTAAGGAVRSLAHWLGQKRSICELYANRDKARDVIKKLPASASTKDWWDAAVEQYVSSGALRPSPEIAGMSRSEALRLRSLVDLYSRLSVPARRAFRYGLEGRSNSSVVPLLDAVYREIRTRNNGAAPVGKRDRYHEFETRAANSVAEFVDEILGFTGRVCYSKDMAWPERDLFFYLEDISNEIIW